IIGIIKISILDRFLLLCSHSEITAEILSSIESHHLEGNGIFVTRDYFKSLVKEYGILPGNSGKTLIQLKYKMLKRDNISLLEDTKRTKLLDVAKADLISQSLDFHIKNSDTASILQCISEIRHTDEYLYTHGLNVGMLNALQGKWLKLSDDKCETLSKIGILHDVGKLKIPQKILDKPGKLTDEEFELIKKHPVFSYEILEKSGITDREVLDGVKSHHERINGSGYPDG
ncbi:MAG: HD domain-containing protein, partial [Oscillospiraceae bacterium]